MLSRSIHGLTIWPPLSLLATSDIPKTCAFDGLPLSGRSAVLLAKGSAMSQGTVKWFNQAKGFGFIQPDEGGKDAFVHISAVERAGLPYLTEGQRLEFELVQDRRGKTAAENLKPVA